MLKGIFFDNDGVLVKTEHLYYEANRVLMNKLGRDLSVEIFVKASLIEGKSIFDVFPDICLSEDEKESLREERDNIYSGILRASCDKLAVPGIEDLLKELSEKYLLGIVTSCRREHFKIIHSRTDILKYFDFIVAEGDYVNSKPYPDPYLKALEKSGLTQEECLAVEDSERGLKSATSAGLRCVVIPDSFAGKGNFKEAFYIVENISFLKFFLKGLE